MIYLESTTSNGKTDVEILLDKINNLTERVQKLGKNYLSILGFISSIRALYSRKEGGISIIVKHHPMTSIFV